MFVCIFLLPSSFLPPYLVRQIAHLRKNLRVDQQDIRHGEEGDDARADLSSYGRPSFFNAKIIKHMLLGTFSSPSIMVQVVVAARYADAVIVGVGVVVVVVLLLVVLPVLVASNSGGVTIHGTCVVQEGGRDRRGGW